MHEQLINDWSDRAGFGTLDGAGARGKHDGPQIAVEPDRHDNGVVSEYGKIYRRVAKLYVWHRDQQFGFELSLLDLGRLALGRPLQLPVSTKHWDGLVEVPRSDARVVLMLLLRYRLQHLRASREPTASRVEQLVYDTAVDVEQRLAPWMLAILERIDRLNPKPGAPS